MPYEPVTQYGTNLNAKMEKGSGTGVNKSLKLI